MNSIAYPPRVRRLRTDPIIGASLLVLGALVVLYFTPLVDPETVTTTADLYGMGVLILLGMAAPWIGLPRMASGRERAFWLLWTLGLGCALLVRLAYLWDPVVEDSIAGALVIDSLYLLFYLALILSLQVRPDRPELRRGQWPVHPLEAFGTAAFVGSLLAYFIVVPAVLDPENYLTFTPALTVFCILDGFILVSLLHLRYHCRDRSWRILYTWFALVLALWIVADVLALLHYSWIVDVWGGPWDVIWYAPWAMVPVTARLRVGPRPDWLGFCVRRRPHPLEESVSRAGWMILAAFSLPVIHFATGFFGIIGPDTEFVREIVMIAFLSVIVAIGLLHQVVMERQSLELAVEKEKAEEHTRLLAAAVEHSQDAVLIADGEGVVHYANPALRFTGLDPHLAKGRPLLEILGFARENPGQGPLKKCLEDGLRWEGTGFLQDKDGKEREEAITVFPVRDAGGALVQSVAVRRDVTYVSQLERQSRQTQKMEALGTLAGGIAHDFNNILGVMYGYGEVMKHELEPDSQAREDLDGLMNAAHRAAGLVRQILTFSRKGGDESEPLPLEGVVSEALDLLRATLPSTIEIRRKLETGAGSVLGVRTQIQQMVLNLCANAAHAMGEGGGVLEVGLKETSLDVQGAETMGLAPGDYHHLSIGDTGRGMDRETLERIFDPFFTTKAVGKGTGLGLAVVHGAVKAHGGAIQVESEPGVGSLFDVYLPRSPRVPETAETVEDPPPDGQGEVVVVVDDEIGLVNLSRKILEGLGYGVVGFSNSMEALDFISEDTGRVQAVVTDQTMPGLTGLELAKELRKKGPNPRVLLTTGFSESVSPERLEDVGIRRVLMKPFSQQELGWAVRDLLDGSPSEPS